MQKVQWTGDGENVTLAMPIQKVDTEKRLVSGFASLDNVDQHGDVVTAEASREAFATARGNLREMHAPVAVGRVVEFKEDVYFDADSENFYQGIYVTAYVSKGAQDTWEKVLDGTLSGFSIGGKVLESDNIFDKAAGAAVRVVTKYALEELSLVDNPANQFANVFSFQKSADGGSMLKGIAVDVEVSNVYYCETEALAKTSELNSLDCASCGNPMVNLGWFESTDADTQSIVKDIVRKHLDAQDSEGGANNMPEQDTKTVEAVKVEEAEAVEEAATEEEQAPAEETEESTTEEATDQEVEVEEVPDELGRIIGEFQKQVTDTLNENAKVTEQQVEELRKGLSNVDSKIDEKLNGLEAKISELENRQSEFTKKFEGISSEVEGFKKNLVAVEQEDEATALKKSADIDQSAENSGEKKFTWGGSFIGTGSL